MLANSPAFILKTTNYSETSVIAKVYTREWGLQSIMVKGVRRAKSHNKQNLLQPLSYVDISMYRNEKRQIQFAKELKPFKQWRDTPFNYEKTAITFFINEFLYKTIREEECDERMFDFIDESLTTLDESDHSLADFPIRFLVKATSVFGFRPLDNHSASKPFFNLHEGRFVSPLPVANTNPNSVLNADTSLVLHQYLSSGDTLSAEVSPSKKQRDDLFLALLEYLKIHFEQLNDLKSHAILHDILR